MRITFDPSKRARTLAERGLDFADAALIFAGLHATLEDVRRDYGEKRFISAGLL
jgi:uncharacterized DUF497 family protein